MILKKFLPTAALNYFRNIGPTKKYRPSKTFEHSHTSVVLNKKEK